jgi:hypothetical protein
MASASLAVIERFMHQPSDSGIYLTCFNTPDVYLMLNTNSFVSRKHDSHTYHQKKKTIHV